MRAFVTGATGLIGHAVVQQLLKAGHEVSVLVRDRGRAERLLGGVKFIAGDITFKDGLADAMAGHQWVFHAAGMPEQWRADPTIFDRVNRGGTANVLEAALEAGVERVIYTSTMDVFGAPAGGTLVESRLDPQPKHTRYERSKQAADREAERIRAKGLEVVHMCPAAVYGPGPVQVGLNSFFIKLLNKQSPVLPPGGMPVLYIEGCARAHLAAATRGRSGERYLLADAHVESRELAQEIIGQSALSRVPPVAPRWLMKAVAVGSEALARVAGVQPLIATGQLTFLEWNVRVDSRKAERELGFEPMPLADGVALTVASLREKLLVP